MTAVDLELVKFDLIVADLGDIVPCEGDDDDCEAPAQWVYRHPCGKAWIFCGWHRASLDTHMRKWSGAVYLNCNARMPRPIPWLPL